MKIVAEINSLIYESLFRGLFVSVIIILIIKLIVKNKIDINISLRIIQIMVITYAFISIVQFTTFMILDNPDEIFWKRAFGPHWWAYWLMFFMNSIFPLTLLFKKLRTYKLYLLLVTALMNIGWIFESFVIHMTNLEREYMSVDYNPYLPTSHEMEILTNGLIVGILLLIIGNLYKWISNKNLKESL